MPSFLPRLFKSRAERKKQKKKSREENRDAGGGASNITTHANVEDNIVRASGEKKLWRVFRFPKRRTMQEFILQIKKRQDPNSRNKPSLEQDHVYNANMAAAADAVAADHEGSSSIISAVSSRRRRRPNMATTQRKLAASKKRLRVAIPRKDTPVSEEHQAPVIPRRITEVSEDRGSSVATTSVEIPFPENASSTTHYSTQRDHPSQPPFVMTHERGSFNIEVEFTDESEPASAERYMWSAKHPKKYSFTQSMMRDGDGDAEKEGEIGVEWKPTARVNSYGDARSSTPSKIQSMHSEISSGHSLSRKVPAHHHHNGGGGCKSMQSSECGSASGSSDVGTEAWTEYRRDRLIEKIAGLRIQQPVESQSFEARKAMKINIPLGEPPCLMVAYPAETERESKEPHWIQQWNSTFQSISDIKTPHILRSSSLRERHHLPSGIPKPNADG